MGCAASSMAHEESQTTHNETNHPYPKNQQETDNTDTNTNTNTNTTDTGGNGTTNTQTKNGAYYPDDNAIYEYDLYEDDGKKKGGDKEGLGEKNQEQNGAQTSDETTTKTDTTTTDNTTQDNTTDNEKDNTANERQSDDTGFFGQTEGEKGEQELFDGNDHKSGDAEKQEAAQNDVINTTDDTVTERKEDDVIVAKEEEEKAEEKVEEKEEEKLTEPVPEPEMKDDHKKHEEDEGTAMSDGGYTQTETGLKTLFLDFRGGRLQDEEDDRHDTRPAAPPDQPWTETSFNVSDAIGDLNISHQIDWKRPTELSDSPKLFSEGTTRYDIGQGGAGTCWFLSTVANISEHPDQLKQVIPDDAYHVGTDHYDGIFHCRFWRFGQWEDVYIDDFLPIVHGTTPWGARSATDPDEFWVSLLEKAFARYHGNYKAVYGGQPGDAYLALTGGVAERIDFDDNEHKSSRLFQRIHNAVNSGALVTCTVPEQYDDVHGLVGGHAYSLTGTATAKGTNLIRVRNPWGNTEWTGPWSDKSAEWSGVSEGEVSRVKEDDGEFWMCLGDFMTYFDQTTICALTPDFDQDGCSDSLNYVTNVYGQWRGESAAGFREKLQNPRYLFTVPKSESEVPVVVQVIQRRKDRQVDNFQVRCDLYKVLCNEGGIAALELMGENTNSYTPETQCSFRHKLTPGTYAMVPSTIEAGMEKSFLIRVFSPCPLLKVGELSRNHKVMGCDQQTSFSHGGRDHSLSHVQAMPGQWKAGVNAGGQIGNRDTHASNPQYLLTVDQPTLVAMSLMQEQTEPRQPLGLRLFPTGEAPLTIDQICEVYEDAVVNTEGSNYKFVQSWEVTTAYMLDPGHYTLILHLDQPDTQKLFTLVFKSPSPVDVKGFQTGM
ncbi:hypothetical protein ACOMHN_054535 [Nucella lapillus]